MSIEALIGKDFELVGHGRYLRADEHDSLVVDREKQLFFWNSKGVFGTALDWLIKVKGYSPEEARRMIVPTPMDVFKYAETTLEKEVVVSEQLVESFYELGKTNREYWLNKRGYTESTIDLWRLGFTGEWYTIPFYLDGEFKNFQCRKDVPVKRIKSWYKGMGPLPFNYDYAKDKDFLVLTEGPVDAIMLMQNGIPAASHNLGAENFNPEWAGRLANVKEIIICYDNDLAGRLGAKKVGKILGYKARIFTFEGFPDKFDVTDFFKGGGTRSELLSLFSNSKMYCEV